MKRIVDDHAIVVDMDTDQVIIMNMGEESVTLCFTALLDTLEEMWAEAYNQQGERKCETK